MNIRLRSPLSVQIEVTSQCTSKCIHCLNFWRNSGCDNIPSDIGALSVTDVESIMYKLNDAGVFRVTVSGGEPLMNYPATLMCIKLAQSMGIVVGLNSNMVLLTKEMAVEMKRVGLNHILTSILGPNSEVHDKISSRRNSFDLLVGAIGVAHEAGLAVTANMVVSQLNHNQVRATAEVVSSLGIKSFIATKAGCPGNCFDFSQISPSQNQVVSFLNDLCWAKETLGLHVDTLESVPFCGLHGVKQPNLFTRRKCNGGATTMTVSYDGSVRPCAHLDESYGNLLSEDLETVWAKMASWSQALRVPPECTSCEILDECGGGCRMEAKMRTGKPNGTDPFARPDFVAEMSNKLYPQNSQPNETPITLFRTSKFKLRHEGFGGVLACGSTYVYLDHQGFAVVKQFEPKQIYDIGNNSIDWNRLDPQQFVSGLVHRRVVSSV